MSDDMAVMHSIGFLEGWINAAEKMGVVNAESARNCLQIVEDAYRQDQRTIQGYKGSFDQFRKLLSASFLK